MPHQFSLAHLCENVLTLLLFQLLFILQHITKFVCTVRVCPSVCWSVIWFSRLLSIFLFCCYYYCSVFFALSDTSSSQCCVCGWGISDIFVYITDLTCWTIYSICGWHAVSNCWECLFRWVIFLRHLFSIEFFNRSVHTSINFEVMFTRKAHADICQTWTYYIFDRLISCIFYLTASRNAWVKGDWFVVWSGSNI